MARRRRAEKRSIIPDSRYESQVVGRLISAIMQRGKKSLAQRIVYGAIDSVNEQNKDGDPLDILNKAPPFCGGVESCHSGKTAQEIFCGDLLNFDGMTKLERN